MWSAIIPSVPTSRNPLCLFPTAQIELFLYAIFPMTGSRVSHHCLNWAPLSLFLLISMFNIIPSAVFYLSFYYGSVNVQFCVSFRCIADASVLSDAWQPVDCSPPGCAVHGILQGPIQARVSCPPPGHLPTHALSLGLLCLPHWQAGSSTLAPLGKYMTFFRFFPIIG